MITNKDIQFKQSVRDFPLIVGLGRKIPEWSLKRWKENQGLRFVPYDDEGFTLRGDRRQLLYKGNRRSHRFTILNDGAFEYDCILNREPENNVITLRMEGAENFDFYRQPDFVRDPFLRGSYAVYLKDTFIGQGTGKLCHLHRPLIIDSLGRKCWGVLSVVSDELQITIPEEFLSSAKYPVTVDPTVGTTTVGSLGDVEDFNAFSLWGRPVIDNQVGLSRYYIAEKSVSLLTAYFYFSWDSTFTHYTKPCVYIENNNLPYLKKSINEPNFPYHQINASNPPRWINCNFNIDGYLSAGSYIWFGLRSRLFSSRFDYETGFLKKCTSSFQVDVPNTVPTGASFQTENIRYSWYFSYEAAPLSENYFFTLVNGVTIQDTKIIKSNYKRIAENIVKINSIIGYLKTIIKRINDTLNNFDIVKQAKYYIRGIFDEARATAEANKQFNYFSYIQENVRVESHLFRSFLIFVKILTTTAVRDFIIRRFLIAREELKIKSCVTREIILESKIC